MGRVPQNAKESRHVTPKLPSWWSTQQCSGERRECRTLLVEPTCACAPHRTNKGRAESTCVGLWAPTLAAMDDNGSTGTMDVDTPALAATLNGGEIDLRKSTAEGAAVLAHSSRATSPTWLCERFSFWLQCLEA